MMITKLQINNFLSHADTVMEFSPGVNVIVGPTDSGKSAIVRALRWLAFNRPVGDSFRSSWGGDTLVRLWVDNIAVALDRFKSDKSNLYAIHMGNEDPDLFEAIRTDVPEEVRAVLKLNEINLQAQFDSHFLLSRSAGEIAQHFNRVAHLDKIDTGIRNVAGWIRGIQSNITADEQALDRLAGELKQYDDIPEIERLVVAAERADAEIDKLAAELMELGRVAFDITQTEEGIYYANEIVKDEGVVDQVLAYADQIEQINLQADELDRLCLDIDSVEAEMAQLDKLVKASVAVDAVIEMNARLVALDDDMVELSELVVALESTQEEIKTTWGQINEWDKQFHEQIGETCPLCGQKIK